MHGQLIASEDLKKADKVLFITHLALGDFTYMQSYFKQLHEQYPHLKIDLWVDEGRGKHIFLRSFKKNAPYILFDWLESCPFFNKIYRGTANARGLRSCIKKTKKERYPIVVNVVGLHFFRYAKYAHKICPKGIKIGLRGKTKKTNLIKNYYLNKLRGALTVSFQDKKTEHIFDTYGYWFKTIFGLKDISPKQKPFIAIPSKWISYAKLKFLDWGIDTRPTLVRKPKTIFINCFAKNQKRCWPLDNAIRLVHELSKQEVFHDANFIVNIMPGFYKSFEKSVQNYSLQRIFLFTAAKNFFQLPAIISLCDLVISVETSTIHFAGVLGVPVIALMRHKSLDGTPYDAPYAMTLTKKRRDWIKDIAVADVVKTTSEFARTVLPSEI